MSDPHIEEARALLQEQDRRLAIRSAIQAELFAEQSDVAQAWLAGARFHALCCSRRAGKTQLIARMLVLSLLASARNEWCVYAARTLGVARNLIWSDLEHLVKKHKLGWAMSEHLGSITTQTGAEFRLCGVDDRASIEKVRGNKYRLFVCDEASTYQEYLEDFVTDSIEPGLFDLQGTLVLAGTPGRVCKGYWYDVVTHPDTFFRVRSWTLKSNPHIRDVQKELQEILTKHQWSVEEPSYRREYLGEWVSDDSVLVYAFTRDRNTCTQLPRPFTAEDYYCTLGIDFGMRDSTAWVVIGSHRHSREVYVLYAAKQNMLLPDEVAKITAGLVARYRPVRAVGDSSGKVYIEEYNRRWSGASGIHLFGAEKHDKVGHIALVNGDLRSGNLKVLLPDASALAGELETLPWLDEARTKEHPAFDNHCSDSFLYSWRAHRAYHNAPPVIETRSKWSTPEERSARYLQSQSQSDDDEY